MRAIDNKVVNQTNIIPSISVKIDWLANNGSRGANNVKAFASMIIGNFFAIHGIKVIESSGGLFVFMPQYKYRIDGNERQGDLCHALTGEGRKKMEEAVLEAYNTKLKNQKE